MVVVYWVQVLLAVGVMVGKAVPLVMLLLLFEGIVPISLYCTPIDVKAELTLLLLYQKLTLYTPVVGQ